VDELNVFLSNGEVQSAAISIEFAKVKTFQAKPFLLVLYIFITLLSMLVFDTLFFQFK